jgi:hypothetical protein
MGKVLLSISAMILASVLVTAGQTKAPPQDNAPALDTMRMSNEITKRTGVVALAAVRPRDKVFDIEIRFGGPLKDYKSAMGAVVAAVGTSSKQASYTTEWCYILTHERGRERILVSDVRQTHSLALDGKQAEAWTYFDGKKTPMK